MIIIYTFAWFYIIQRMKKLRPIMLAGTGSDVGKSIVATGFCRIFVQDGYHPAPFKAQNMALNSYATPDGFEIGRAQAVQAEAAGIPCHTDMNPLLLKPQDNHTSQVVLHGRVLGQKDAYDYWRFKQTTTADGRTIDFRSEVCQAYDRLAAHYNPIVMEGAGSIAELNLHDTDIVNLPMARHAGAVVILVADIDRGGVFASAYGSIALQDEADRRLIKGIIINKFRGDLRLFDKGREMMEQICGVPVLGVLPYLPDLHIEEEDSVALDRKNRQADAVGKVKVAVVRLPHLSNFTDFDSLEHSSRVHIYYTYRAEDLLSADVVIVPGSKNTIADLSDMRCHGIDEAILGAHRRGAVVLGICGGYQMLGQTISDPTHQEGDAVLSAGLGLLPVSTIIGTEKTTRQVSAQLLPAANAEVRGYEIHMGSTVPAGDAVRKPLLRFSDGTTDGYVADSNGSGGLCIGTYLHGILDNAVFADYLLQSFPQTSGLESAIDDYGAFRERQYDLLADHVRRHVDMTQIYNILSSDD